MELKVKWKIIRSGYDHKTCWVHARAGFIPHSGKALITAQKLRLSGSDIFYSIHNMHSDDGGESWSPFIEQKAFAPRQYENGAYFYVSDFWPKWHSVSETMIGTGHSPLYKDDEMCLFDYSRKPVFAIYDTDTNSWTDWKFTEMPEEELFYHCGAGCSQRVDLPNGDILLPITCRERRKNTNSFEDKYYVTVVCFSFDGNTLIYKKHGNFITVKEPRGLYEASLASTCGQYCLTIRNDQKAYLALSKDGLNFSNPTPWIFDDGKEIGSYNTQQHWLSLGDRLFLVYTRKNFNNDHVFRHRAPLFIAEMDPDKKCLIRKTEKIVVPERGARLGNFGITEIPNEKAWIVASEWMQGPKGINGEPEELEKYGCENSIFISSISS